MIHATGNLAASKTHKIRSWSFVAVEGGEHLGTLTIAQGKKDQQSYDVEEDASYQAGGVRTFILRKQSEPETLYEVVVRPLAGHPEPGQVRCNCSGHGRWKTCKHADAIGEALAEGVLDGVGEWDGIDQWFERVANEEGPIDQEEQASDEQKALEAATAAELDRMAEEEGCGRWRPFDPEFFAESFKRWVAAQSPVCHGCDDTGRCGTCHGTTGYPAGSCTDCCGTGHCPHCRPKAIEQA